MMEQQKQERVIRVSQPVSKSTIVPDQETNDFLRYILDSKAFINQLTLDLAQAYIGDDGKTYQVTDADGKPLKPRMNAEGIAYVRDILKTYLAPHIALASLKEEKILKITDIIWKNLRRGFLRNWDQFGMTDDPFMHNSLAQNISLTIYHNLSRAEDATTVIGILKPLSRNETVSINPQQQKEGIRTRIGNLI